MARGVDHCSWPRISHGIAMVVAHRMLLLFSALCLLGMTEWMGADACRLAMSPLVDRDHRRARQMVRPHCGRSVKRRCLKRPLLLATADSIRLDCNRMPEVEVGCKPPGMPRQLNVSIMNASSDFVSIRADWKMPPYPGLCRLTGYHVAIFREENGNQQGSPCTCFNLSATAQHFLLNPNQDDCMRDCLEINKYGLQNLLTVVVTPLPVVRSSIQTGVTMSVRTPSCQELDPRPDYCHSFPPAPPTLSSTILKNGSVHIRWNEPKHDSTINITKYILMYRRRDGPPIFHIEEVGPEIREYMTGPPDLEFDVSYVFWLQADSTSVRSASRDGRSGYSNPEYVILNSSSTERRLPKQPTSSSPVTQQCGLASVCGNAVQESCMRQPDVRPLGDIDPLRMDCTQMAEFDKGDTCKQPGIPLHLQASVGHSSHDYISIVVDWRMPPYPEFCPLTGYHVAIWKEETGGMRGEPCACVNVSAATQTFTLSSKFSECAMLSGTGSPMSLEIRVTSLPVRAYRSRQSAVTSLDLPRCVDLDPRPAYCQPLSTFAPIINLTDHKNGSVYLHWNEPQHDPTVSIAKYILTYRRTDGSTPFMTKTFGPGTREVTTRPGELDINAEYMFMVQAVSTSALSGSEGETSAYSNAEYVTPTVVQ